MFDPWAMAKRAFTARHDIDACEANFIRSFTLINNIDIVIDMFC